MVKLPRFIGTDSRTEDITASIGPCNLSQAWKKFISLKEDDVAET